MDADRPAPAQLAKGALRRLAAAKLEPTPANYARAYADEAGEPLPAEGALPARARVLVDRLVMRTSDDATLRGELSSALMEARYDDLQRALDRGVGAAAAQAQAWAQTIDRLAKGLERGGRHWTGARKKDSLQRVLEGSGSDSQRLQQRLKQLITAWEKDQPDDSVDVETTPDAELANGTDAPAALAASTAPEARAAGLSADADAAAIESAPAQGSAGPDDHPRIVEALQTTVRAGLPTDEPRAAELADELAALASRVAREGATAELADGVADVCHRVRRLLGVRHELVDELLALCRSLTDGIADLAEERSWAQCTAENLHERLQGAAGARAVRAARQLVEDTRAGQRALQSERLLARDALRQMVRQVLAELGDLGDLTGRFNETLGTYTQAIESADSIASLADAVRTMVDESQAVHDLVGAARARLAAEHERASQLEGRVLGLEADLRRLSEEVSTDALTRVANRRGLATAFEQECSRVDRDGPQASPLAVGLIDIDNFKKLNDSLGHAAGDVALQSLAARVKEWLRPIDHIARFGGEEFVLLLPGTPVDEAQQVMTRLQRRLSASLFMHEGQEVFVTFSAGVTPWRPGETIDAALARADEGLYEAKRTGKNRTCIA